MPLMRLQKFLSAAGVCSRRRGEELIRAGEVAVNAVVVTELGTKVDPEKDRVHVGSRLIEYRPEPIYILFHKPKGVVTSCRQKRETTVVDLLDIGQRVYPVGRLDKDSTGLLLLTNDGRLHLRLSHPSFNHEKEYDVRVAKPISDYALQKMAEGMPILGTRTRPARIERLSATRFRMTLMEGKNRQIRRMVRQVGNEVKELKRIRMAGISLGRLPAGAWRYLSAKEKNKLLELVESSQRRSRLLSEDSNGPKSAAHGERSG
jgi:pseudouridine synthase